MKASAKVDGYHGIWFTLGQFSDYGDKYSGGLGTYTAKHVPLAVYTPEVNKTFFVYGGAKDRQRHLLAMAAYYDHAHHVVPRPTIVHDKGGVDDPHDNPSIAIDGRGHVWIFVSGRGRSRPGFKYRSIEPYSVEAFEQVTEEEMTYPQPWWVEGNGFLHLFTKYTGVRELIGTQASMVTTGERIKSWLVWVDITRLAADTGIASARHLTCTPMAKWMSARTSTLSKQTTWAGCGERLKECQLRHR